MGEAPTAQPRASLSARLRARIHPSVGPLAVAAAALGAMAVVHVVDPNEPGNFPTCPWLALTGTYCPGCGTMRAVAALSHLDPAGAVQMNLLLLLLAPFIMGAWARWLYRSLRPPAQPPPLPPTWWIWTLLSAILGFWLLRNMPFLTVLAPGGELPPVFG